MAAGELAVRAQTSPSPQEAEVVQRVVTAGRQRQSGSPVHSFARGKSVRSRQRRTPAQSPTFLHGSKVSPVPLDCLVRIVGNRGWRAAEMVKKRARRSRGSMGGLILGLWGIMAGMEFSSASWHYVGGMETKVAL